VPAAGTDPSATTRQQRLGIRHRTGYRYAGDVVMSYNEARMTPLTTPWQTTLEARIEVAPSATTYRYWDYWGTQVTGFDVRDPHDRLEVTARSVVETHPAITVTSEQTVAWSELGSAVVLDRFAELLAPTTRCAVGDEAVELARVVVQGLDPVQAGRAVAEWLAELLDYVPGATGVHTSAMQAWQGGKGVCQDFAHIATGVLRRLGIPARYVSGYLLPLADAPVGEQVRGESHAWIEWWSGDWQAWDPTNGRPAGADHVVVARARDYDDVTPLKGIYSGPGGGELFVSVEFTRLA
jgi:Transglutaminase-like enzymes, putative cysteine proteases